MDKFIFDLQRFDTVTINAGKSQTIDGVTYTAQGGDAVLNRDDDNKVSGLASGSVTAVVSGAETSPTITFDATDGAIDFTCTQDDGALKVRYQNHSLNYTSGSVTYSNKRITFPEGDVVLTATLGNIIPLYINVTIPESGLTGIFDGDKFNLASTNTVAVSVTFSEELKSIIESEVFKDNLKGIAAAILKIDEDSFEKLFDVTKQLITTSTTLNLSGEFTYDRTDKSFSFAQDSKLDISVLNYGISLAAVDGVLDGFRFYNEKTDDSISVGAKISPSSGDGKLDFILSENGNTLFKDVLKINSGLLTIDLTNAKLSLDANSSLNMTVRELYTATIASTDAISATFSADANGNIVLTPDGKVFKVTLQRDSATVFDGTIQLSNGSLLFNQETHSITLTQGTKMTFTQNNNSISLTANDAAGAQIVADEKGVYTITPGKNDGSIDIAIKQNGETIFQSTVSVDGPISFDLTNRLLTLADGTTVSLEFDDYKLTATADGNASSTISITDGNSITNTEDKSNSNVAETAETADGNDSITDSLAAKGISITPDTEDEGKFTLTLTRTSGDSLSAEIELLSGSFILGEDGTLSVTKGTELQIKFSDDYIVNFKATDNAGGVISLSDEGITFSPNSNDGGLELSVTRDGETRSASLDVTGSVTYKLDGSISLAQGTVVRNVFEDGNILTITANTDASGSINFNPQTGLTITPATADALTATLTTGDLEVVNVSAITGSINYNGGVITASDGTKARISYYFGWESDLYTTGGTASIQFTDDRTIYTANEGSTFTVDYLDGTTTEIQNGSYADVYGENIEDYTELVSEGTTLRSNDAEVVFTLEKAGNYTLNGMSVTTSADNVEVMLANYDTITFGQGAQIDIATSISGNDLDVVASATQGQGTVTVDDDGNITYDATNGTLQISVPLENVIGDSLLPSDFTISGGSVTMGATDADGIKTISIPQGTTISFTKNGMTFTGVTQNDINGRLWMRNGTVLYLHSYEEAIFDVTTTFSNTTTFNGTVTLGGAFSYNAANGTVGSVDSNTYNVHDSYIQIAVGNQTLRFTTNGETFFAVLNVDDNGKITLDFINENYNSMLATVSLGGNTVLNAALVVNGSIVVDPATLGITLTKDTAITMTQGSDVVTITALDEAGGKVSFSGNVISFTPNENDGALSFVLVRDGTTIFGGTLNVTSGTISFDTTEQRFSFTKGTKVALGIGISELEIEVTGDDASFKMEADGNGNITITPDTDDGSLDITFKRNGEAVLQNNVSVNGSMIFNPTTRLLTLVDGTTVNVAFDNYTLTATADGDASSEISLSASGISITPQTGDGKLNLTLTGTSSGSLSASIEVLSGGFVFGTTGALTVTEGTELQIDFGDGYIVNFKATDDAGGAISLGADGITFAPNTDDGNLQLTITRDGQTRSASLDVTGGSVTYKLDGSISLTKGTVVKNVFDSGNILTITANTDASGSITFNPQTGLTITPSTADALNVVLSTDNLEVVNVSSITGSINYNGGVITASDGTKAHISYYFGWESDLYTTGGTASIQFTDDRTIYTANEGSTFTVDYLDGTITEIQNGSYADVYGETIEDYTELVAEGTILRSNDETVVFTLEKAGNYTLNGMKVTTTKDNVEVMLPDYNTVQFAANAGITFNGQEFSGDNIITLNDGNIIIENTEDNATVTGTALADSISNSGEGVTITALAGNDTITNTGASAIINGGAGDDLIQIDGDNVTIEYSAGNDTITGFDETSTLSIGENVYSTQQSGDDLIITVGESKITLVGAASLSAPNIESTNPAVELIETILKRTALGYPVMAAIAFHPEEYHGDEPTNYSNKEDWTITSSDNLELHAVHYTPENSNDKWAVIVHGYGHNHKHMYPFAGFYLANGYNVLMVDQRTAGDSEGTWLTMGAAEGADVALWTQEIARRNSNAKITLHGVSMGSATAMLAAARSDAVNVTSLIEDCGYTSAMDVFYLLNEAIVNAPTEVIAALDLVGEGMTGYYLHDAAPINSISSAKMPTLFISGDSDSVVPISMLASLYEASGAEVKEEFIVKGVGHGRAGLEDPIGYSNAVFRFVAEANGEGWDTANITDDISLRGTKYNDTIANSGDNVTINTGAGDDLIQLDADNVRIEYTAGNDTIEGFDESTALQISGDYSTATSGDNVVVTVGENAITLTDAATLDALNIFNDTTGQTINNIDDNTLISGGNGDDSISNIGDDVTINSGVGNDSIYNIEGQRDSINAGLGNDTILNEHAYYPTIEGGAGDDLITIKRGHYTNIDGGTGNDTILGEAETTSGSWAMGGYAIINGGDGNDYINPETTDSSSIMGGAGADTIITSGNDSTINGGDDDDIISLHGASVDNNIIEYETNSGNDIVYGLNSTGLISLTTGAEYSTAVSGDDVIVTVGENEITVAGGASLSTLNVINYELTGSDIENTVNNTLITGTRFDDEINNEGSNVTIDAQAGKDTVFNYGASASINGGAGDDSIFNNGQNVTISGDYGDDYVSNWGSSASVSGGYGNDTIYNNGSDATINGGGGNDSISNDGENLLIEYSGGMDTVVGFNETSTISVSGDFSKDDIVQGTRNVLIPSGDYFLTLQDAMLTTDSINVNGETIELDKTINLLGGGSAIISRSNITVNAGEGENLITLTDDAKNNNIVLAGNTTVEGFKTGFGEGTDTIYIDGDPAGVEFKDGGLTFGNSTDSLTLSDITTTEKINIYHERRQVLNKGVFIAENDWYSVQSSDLSVGSGEEVYFVGTTSESQVGVDFSGISSALNVTMDTAYEDSEDFVPGTTTWINSVYSLKGGAGNTTITGSKNSDTIIAGTGATTINAAAGDDNISLGSSAALVQYTSGDGNDTIEGFNSNSTLQIGDGTGTYSTQVSGSDVVVTVGDEAITLVDASDVILNIIGGSGSISPQPSITSETVEEIQTAISADSIQPVSGDTLKVDNDDGNNLVYVESDAKGSKKVTLGAGGDAVVIESAKANVSVTGGKGDDSLIVKDSAAVEFDMSKGGKDRIYLASDDAKENVTLKGYNASNDGGIVVGTSDIAGAIQNKDITFGNGSMKMGAANAKVTFAGHTSDSGSTTVKLFDANDEAQAVGFTHKSGGNLNVSSSGDDNLLVGNYFDDKSDGSTLLGGAGNDTLLGGEGDVLNAGGGKENLIILQDEDNRDGASIILSEGKTTVENFKAGFEDGDKVLTDLNAASNKFDGENVTVTSGAARAVLQNISSGDGFVKILETDTSGNTYKVAIAQAGAIIAAGDDTADAYYGEKSGVDFTGFDESLTADLSKNFYGINQVTAGGGQTTLMGSARNETLYAGTGTASLYGAGGKNLLANSSEEKDGATTFVVLGNADGARNTIQGFNFVTEDGVADKIEVDTNTNVVSGVRIDGNDVVIEVSNRKGTASERAVINGAVGQDMKFGDNVIAQVNTTALTYDGTANFFVATGKNAGISVGAEVGSKAAIWLGNENFVGDFRTIDATASSVKAELAGNDADNVISAGSGDSSLWGGNGGDDFMQGGTGKNAFFYTNGNGDDTIGGTNTGDLVYLSEMTLDQIASTSVTNNVATINFKDGGKLTINDASNCNYVMTQGDQSQIYKVSGDNFVNA